MFLQSPDLKVYLALGYTDMRKAINGLSMITEQLEFDPFSGHLFVFCNRRRNILKILYWERNGFCLWQKRLEKQRFKWPKTEAEVLQVGQRELRWLLDGLKITQRSAHRQLHYETVL
jgi:transposase